MKRFLPVALLFAFLAACTTLPAQTPTVLTVGTSPYLTIQSAVTTACGPGATGQWQIVIPAGATPSDTIATATGCTRAFITDQRVTPNASCYWTRPSYLCNVGPQPPTPTPGGGTVRETRTLKVATVESGTVPAGATYTIFSATGAGSVENIQMALIGGGGAFQGGNITITVDGASYTTTLGLFYLTLGQYDTPQHQPQTFNSKNLSLQYFNGQYSDQAIGFGGNRRIYIPFKTSCTITFTNNDTAAASIFTQVENYSGAPPTGLHNPLQGVFHMVQVPFGTTAAPFAVTTFLNNVAGPGILDSFYLFVLGTTTTGAGVNGNPIANGNAGLPYWLEGNPSLVFDGSAFTYGGTEDFFCGQFYYGLTNFPHLDECGVSRYGTSPTNQNFYTGMYRYFHETPAIFQTSLSISWPNGQVNEPSPSLTPPAVTLGGLVVYYTAN